MRRTPLHDWHRTNGGRMVGFAGWDMPVQYRSGIVAEHLATRRSAGLFDVSHMGRFRLRGAGAEAFLRRTLTNDAAVLAPGRAQYTFLANERGGAEDDAYLYRIAADDFLLVVNASNRTRGLEWLGARLEGGVRLADESEALAMIALQGPHSARMLETIVPAEALPEDRRNRHVNARFEDAELIAARTGYTGEAVGFELFVAAHRVEGLWARLAAAGAAPAGLGARDSLRLQAGLPLYGHELGEDPGGTEIPIFANAVARFGVRRPGGGPDYVGRRALDRQREEIGRFRRGEPGGAPAPRPPVRRPDHGLRGAPPAAGPGRRSAAGIGRRGTSPPGPASPRAERTRPGGRKCGRRGSRSSTVRCFGKRAAVRNRFGCGYSTPGATRTKRSSSPGTTERRPLARPPPGQRLGRTRNGLVPYGSRVACAAARLSRRGGAEGRNRRVHGRDTERPGGALPSAETTRPLAPRPPNRLSEPRALFASY